MKKNKVIIAVISILLIIITASAIVLANTENIGTQLGSIFKQFKIDKKDPKNTIFESDEITITDDDIQYYKAMNSTNGTEISDEDIKKSLISNALLFKEAEKAGVSLTDAEVKDNMIRDIEGALEDTQGTFRSFLENSGMTKEEYLERAFPVYKKSFTISKYKNFYLKNEFKEKNSSLNEKELKDQFDKFYKQYKDDLYNNFMEHK